MTKYIVSLKQFSLVRKIREHDSEFKFVRSNKMRNRVLNYQKDIIIHPPASATIVNEPDNYYNISRFVYSSKKTQRSYLNEFVKTPESYEAYNNLYVHRPDSHFGARDYSVVHLDDLENYKSSGYISPVYNKKHEYRVFYVRGKPVVTLLKRPIKDIQPHEPYNYGNTMFVTVNNRENDRLRHVEFYQKMEEFFHHYPLTIAAVDVGVNLYDGTYAVFEVNTLPSVQIENNLDSIMEALHSVDEEVQDEPVRVSAEVEDTDLIDPIYSNISNIWTVIDDFGQPNRDVYTARVNTSVRSEPAF